MGRLMLVLTRTGTTELGQFILAHFLKHNNIAEDIGMRREYIKSQHGVGKAGALPSPWPPSQLPAQ